MIRTEQQLLHVARLVGQLRARPDVQRYFIERKIKQPSAPGDFLRALMPGMLTDSELLTLATECTTPVVFLAARNILLAEAVQIVHQHDSLADVRREVPVLMPREKVYA